MKDFDEVLGAYFASRTGSLVQDPPAASEGPGDQRAKTADMIHAHAYFVLLVAQFEAAVNERVSALVAEGRAGSDPGARRLWDVFERRAVRGDPANLPFEDRLALLMDRGTHHVRDAVTIYRMRNRIAHGDWVDEGIDIAEVAATFRTVADSLQDRP